MKQPIYKYTTFWGILGGAVLGIIYIKVVAKDKGISVMKGLALGSALGGAIGLGIDVLYKKKDNSIAEKKDKNVTQEKTTTGSVLNDILNEGKSKSDIPTEKAETKTPDVDSGKNESTNKQIIN